MLDKLKFLLLKQIFESCLVWITNNELALKLIHQIESNECVWQYLSL